MKRNYIFGALSLLTVLFSIIFYFIVKSGEFSTTFSITIFSVASLLGIIFAIITKRIETILIGVTLNVGMILIILFLVLSVGLTTT